MLFGFVLHIGGRVQGIRALPLALLCHPLFNCWVGFQGETASGFAFAWDRVMGHCPECRSVGMLESAANILVSRISAGFGPQSSVGGNLGATENSTC